MEVTQLDSAQRISLPRITGIATAVPSQDVAATYREWARRQIGSDRERAVFDRMADRSGIAHRWSILNEPDAKLANGSFYARSEPPGTAERMKLYANAAPALALEAIRKLPDIAGITHLVVASCTGFVAPGIDQIIARELGLDSGVERTLIGFMGCYAGAIALRTARHFARSAPDAKVLVVTVEIASVHLQPISEIEPLLAMMQFADGAAAAMVENAGAGLALGENVALAFDDSAEMITWNIIDTGFSMHLSGEVPGRLAEALAREDVKQVIARGSDLNSVDGWAVHAGGRSILDAVTRGLNLADNALDDSRTVLRENGNMSSATLLFAMETMMQRRPERGIALAFGPGLAMEGFHFGAVDAC